MTRRLTCLVADRWVRLYRSELEGLVGVPVEWAYSDSILDAGLAIEVAGADVFVGGFLGPAAARAGRDLLLVQATGVGNDGIALSELRQETLVAIAAGHARSVAEHVLMSMLALSRRLITVDQGLRRGEWLGGAFVPRRDVNETLDGKRCGLIGFGAIGHEVARLAAAFGMSVAALRRHPMLADGGCSLEWVGGFDALPRLLAWADFTVVAVPLTGETRGMIDGAALAHMPPTSRLVNVARAGIVDECDLYAALHERRIAGAALDVWYRHPGKDGAGSPADLPFWELENVVLTPHSASTTREVFDHRIALIARNVEAVARGEAVEGVVPRT